MNWTTIGVQLAGFAAAGFIYWWRNRTPQSTGFAGIVNSLANTVNMLPKTDAAKHEAFADILAAAQCHCQPDSPANVKALMDAFEARIRAILPPSPPPSPPVSTPPPSG